MTLGDVVDTEAEEHSVVSTLALVKTAVRRGMDAAMLPGRMGRFSVDVPGVGEWYGVLRTRCAYNKGQKAVDIQHAYVEERCRRNGVMVCFCMAVIEWCNDNRPISAIYMLRCMVENEESFVLFWNGSWNVDHQFETFSIIGHQV